MKQVAIKLQQNNSKIYNCIVNLSEDGAKFRIVLDTVWYPIEKNYNSLVLNDDLVYSVCKVVSDNHKVAWPNNPEYHIAGIVLDDLINPDFENIIFNGSAKLNETDQSLIWAGKWVYKSLGLNHFEKLFYAEFNPFEKSSNLHGVNLYGTDTEHCVYFELN